jgi:hypothetical protein
MTEVLLKNIDPIVIEELQKMAVVNNRTLEEEIANILQIFTEKQQSKKQFNQAWNKIEKLRQAHGNKVFSDSVELLREDRQRG